MDLRTHFFLHLEDRGQDFTWFRVDAAGEIVDCGPFQADTWVGRHVRPDTKSWKAGSRVIFTADNKVLNYPVTVVDIIDLDFELAQLRLLVQSDGPVPVASKATAADVTRLARQGLAHWSEAPRTPGSPLRGHAGITAAGLDFLNRMTGGDA
ncbi:MAG: hypothetical protein LDL39_12765 [Magnetospirillum sp.]|nr:hypothetical protein [Magnetospirillum sp.]